MNRKDIVYFDEANKRYVIQFISADDISNISVREVIRILQRHLVSWPVLKEFTGATETSDLFKIAFVGNTRPAITDLLQTRVQVDNANKMVYFYSTEGIGPVDPSTLDRIIKVGSSGFTIQGNIPARVFASVEIIDPLNSTITMRVEPQGEIGHLIGYDDISLTGDGESYTIRGNVSTLNSFLRSLKFIPNNISGDMVINIVIDDGFDTPRSLTSNSVSFKCEMVHEPSVPTIVSYPDNIVLSRGKATAIEPIVVEDADGKKLVMKIYAANCSIRGFATNIHTQEMNTSRFVYGTPEIMNKELANLMVTSNSPKGYIAIELHNDANIERQYIRYTTEEVVEPDTISSVDDVDHVEDTDPAGTVEDVTVENTVSEGAISEDEVTEVPEEIVDAEVSEETTEQEQ